MLWSVAEPKKISAKIKDVITNPDNTVLISTISFWEVSLKSALGKLHITGFSPEELPDACIEIGFEIESLSADDSSSYHLLKATYHKDPFDRMLIWQAIRNGYVLISSDDTVKKYASAGLQVLK
jgi:PIN domain nuclease of toxin-antitoxin system